MTRHHALNSILDMLPHPSILTAFFMQGGPALIGREHCEAWQEAQQSVVGMQAQPDVQYDWDRAASKAYIETGAIPLYIQVCVDHPFGYVAISLLQKWVCPECPRSFNTPRGMMLHIGHQHPKE